jgi:hypothetical protein
MRAVVDTKQFMKTMNGLINYSIGFVEGIERGKTSFFAKFGASVSELLQQYIDSNARANPQLLHHVYEWGQTGSPDSRLFDIQYIVSGLGLSFNSTFRQSTTVKSGSNVPFYDKARIMEEGIPVTIVPKNRVLAFEDNGEQVFTTQPVKVDNPGGNVRGEYEQAFNSFFNRYFTQAFLVSSGIAAYLERPVAYKENVLNGARMGKAKGVEVGQRWIAQAGVIR